MYFEEPALLSAHCFLRGLGPWSCAGTGRHGRSLWVGLVGQTQSPGTPNTEKRVGALVLPCGQRQAGGESDAEAVVLGSVVPAGGPVQGAVQ